MQAIVVAGRHKGRIGTIISLPWLGNLWNLKLTLNVPATKEEIEARYKTWGRAGLSKLVNEMKKGDGPREWIRVWRWQIV